MEKPAPGAFFYVQRLVKAQPNSSYDKHCYCCSFLLQRRMCARLLPTQCQVVLCQVLLRRRQFAKRTSCALSCMSRREVSGVLSDQLLQVESSCQSDHIRRAYKSRGRCHGRTDIGRAQRIPLPKQAIERCRGPQLGPIGFATRRFEAHIHRELSSLCVFCRPSVQSVPCRRTRASLSAVPRHVLRFQRTMRHLGYGELH